MCIPYLTDGCELKFGVHVDADGGHRFLRERGDGAIADYLESSEPSGMNGGMVERNI